MASRRRAARLACSLAAAVLLRGAAATRNEGAGELAALVMLGREEVAELKKGFVDAGSSGSKYFAICGTQEAEGKLTTRCGRGLSEGIAALMYDQGSKCEGGKWQLNDGLGDLASASDYAARLLKGVRGAMDAISGCSDGALSSVPILATAGMRLISAGDNEKVWGAICGKAAWGLRFPHAGEGLCGTIPGTLEAYYEYLAYVVQLPTRSEPFKPSGIFSMGGASAQIALPLVTEEDMRSFGELIARVRQQIDCTALKVASGDDAPVFTDPQWRSRTNPKEACVADYIAIREWKDVQGLTNEEAVNAGLVKKVGESAFEPAVKGVGLISFLTLRGGGGLVAGGVFEVQQWAMSQGCGGPLGRKPFSECRQLLSDALDKDVLWRNVREYFMSKVTIQSFSYNTPPAVPSNSFDPTDSRPGGATPTPAEAVGRGPDQAWRLADELQKECRPAKEGGHGGDWVFGWHRTKTCEGAYYQALYTTAFFVQEEQGELTYAAGEISWTNGAMRVPVGSLLEADDALLRLPLRRHSASYAEGAMRHLAAAAAAGAE